MNENYAPGVYPPVGSGKTAATDAVNFAGAIKDGVSQTLNFGSSIKVPVPVPIRSVIRHADDALQTLDLSTLVSPFNVKIVGNTFIVPLILDTATGLPDTTQIFWTKFGMTGDAIPMTAGYRKIGVPFTELTISWNGSPAKTLYIQTVNSPAFDNGFQDANGDWQPGSL